MDTGIRLALTLAQIGAVMVAVLLTVALLTLLERKVLGWVGCKIGWDRWKSGLMAFCNRWQMA